MTVRLLLFASSFAVALALLGVRAWGRDQPIALLLLLVAGLSVVPALVIVWYARGASQFRGTVVRRHGRAEAIAGYLATYVLPVILVDPGDTFDVIAVAAFVILLSLVYAASDLHYLNPLLPLIGLRVWEVVVRAPDRRHYFVALSRTDLLPGACVDVVGEGPVRLVRPAKRE